MGICAKILLVGLIIALAALAQLFITITTPQQAPKLDVNEYWGPGSKKNYKEDTSIIPNKIQYSPDVIDDLKKRLNRTFIYHDPLENTNFEYGFNSKRLKEVVDYWRTNYLPRWRERELFLWKFPHLTTYIQGLRIHFIQTKVVDEKIKKTKKVYPVLLLHGWPGSVREFYDIIPSLMQTNKDHDYVFEVVAPSLPGYGWSQGASKKGLGTPEIAVIMRNLMLRLGYNKFFIQGGDWGSLIGSNIAEMFPENVLGYHSNMCAIHSPLSMVKTFIASFKPALFVDKEYVDFYYPIKKKLSYLVEESGYMHLQATKPDTIGTALTDNPIGLAAYIIEKFGTWTDSNYRNRLDGGFEKDFTLDALLDNIMIYYLTNSITTSQRLYAEALSSKQRNLHLERVQVNVPAACAKFKHDLVHGIDWALKEKFVNLVQSNHYPNGGHFAAMQLPNVLYKDFVSFVDKVVKKSVEKVVKSSPPKK